MNDKKDNEISSLDEFFDDDPTDEFPVLNLQDNDPAPAEQHDRSPADNARDPERPPFTASGIPVLYPDAAIGANQTNASLRQMELEIQALQANWHEMEDEVRSRDEFIDGLEDELRTERSSFDELRVELDAMRAELDTANERCARLTAENAENVNAADEQQQKLLEAQSAIREQQAAADELRDELAESRQELASVAEASEKLETENLLHRDDAVDLNQRLAMAEDELKEQTARADVLQESLDETKAKLTELEANSSKLTTDHSERLQVVEDQTRQIERLQAASVELKLQSDDLANYIAGRKSDWDSLHTELALQNDANVSLHQAIAAKSDSLEREKQEKAVLMTEVDSQRNLAARLKTELSQSSHARAEERSLRLELEEKLAAGTEYSTALETANAELTDVATAQRVMTDELSEKNHEIDQLTRTLNQLETEHAESVVALQKQREIIQHMENEVRSKLQAITVIGRSAQRNKGKPASVHRLEIVRSDKSGSRHTSRANPAERMMIALTGERNRRYRIENGTMTIGRGKENDIRLRHHFISRNHAQILTDADGSVIEDLGSKNGVLVNAKPVSRRRLHDGDLVDIGEMQFRFVDPVKQPDEHKTH